MKISRDWETYGEPWEDRIPIKDRFTAWAFLTSVALAGFTGKMILDNMFHRTIGKTLSKATVPIFVLSLAVSGGYLLSDRIDPDKGTSRFTDSLLDPFSTARTTAVLGTYAIREHLVSPDISTGKPLTGSVFGDPQSFTERVLDFNARYGRFL